MGAEPISGREEIELPCKLLPFNDSEKRERTGEPAVLAPKDSPALWVLLRAAWYDLQTASCQVHSSHCMPAGKNPWSGKKAPGLMNQRDEFACGRTFSSCRIYCDRLQHVSKKGNRGLQWADSADDVLLADANLVLAQCKSQQSKCSLPRRMRVRPACFAASRQARASAAEVVGESSIRNCGAKARRA